MILSAIKQGIDEGAITSVHDAYINSSGSLSPMLLMSIIAESYSMKPLENSKVHNWKDDELITKELLQTIEDKLRISLTKTDLLNYLFLAYLTAEEETPEENPFDLFIDSIGSSYGTAKEIGQLKTYLVQGFGDMDSYGPKEEPFYFITNTSLGGLWEPRGLMEIYLLPTSNKSQLNDLEFEMDYRNSRYGLLNLEYFPSTLNPGWSDLVAWCYLKTPETSNISQRLTLSLSYSEETGLYTGSDINVVSTYAYTCSFDPKTWKFTLSIGEPADNQRFADILGKEIVGVSIQSKNQSYISTYDAASYYLNDAPYKRIIYVRGSSYESKIIGDYSYTLTEN